MNTNRKIATIAALAATLITAGFAQEKTKPLVKGDYVAYVGTYTHQIGKGIYAFRFQPKTGKLKPMGLMAETPEPSFIAIHPNRKYLYAVNEVSDYEGHAAGSVSAFSIEAKTGVLKFLNKVSSGGAAPCHVVVDQTGKCVLTANYGSGSIAAFPVRDDGSLGAASAFVQHTGSSVNPRRQAGPHAHSINISPDNRFVLAADLGLDRVMLYRLDPQKATLTPNDPPFVKAPPGSGPRHLVFHPNGRFAYLLGEMGGNVTAFGYDAARGTLEQFQQISTLAENYKGPNGSAEIAVHPNGRFLYASNRGPDDIAIFSIDAVNGQLAALDRVSTGGKNPRNFAIDPTGTFLLAANQDSNNIVVFRIDPKTGKMAKTGEVAEVGAPVSIDFLRVP